MKNHLQIKEENHGKSLKRNKNDDNSELKTI